MLRSIRIETHGPGLYEFTDRVEALVQVAKLGEGLLNLFIQHTSASLVIQENADRAVQEDLQRFYERLVPEGDPLFTHVAEGPDDMPAHVRAALTATSLSIPFSREGLALGTWQGIFLWEHRQRGSERRVAVHLAGS